MMEVGTPFVWWKPLFLLAYTRDARLGDILNLRREDVNFGEGQIGVVRREATEHSLGWEPGDHEGRVLPLPVESQEWLARLRLGSAKGSPYVFVPPRRWAHIQEAVEELVGHAQAPLRLRGVVAHPRHRDLVEVLVRQELVVEEVPHHRVGGVRYGPVL